MHIQRTLGLAAIFTIFGKNIFFQKIQPCHNTIWAPNTILSSRKKLKNQLQENFWREG